MPCLYIMSLFEKRKRKYGGRIKKVRQDLADFLDAFESQAGAEAASVIRAYAAVPRCYFLNSDDAGDADDQDAFSAVGRLARQEAQLLRKLRSTDCFYHEGRKPPYVLWYYGIDWDDLRQMLGEDGRLPLEQVLRLLDVLRSDKPVRQVEDGKLVFQRRRRTLVRLLQTAVSLEEELVCRFPSRTTFGLSFGPNDQSNPEEETQ
ncbi:MAG: hypothetical protein ACLQNE_32150 [Thermoguttaceae bacterium]